MKRIFLILLVLAGCANTNYRDTPKINLNNLPNVSEKLFKGKLASVEVETTRDINEHNKHEISSEVKKSLELVLAQSKYKIQDKSHNKIIIKISDCDVRENKKFCICFSTEVRAPDKKLIFSFYSIYGLGDENSKRIRMADIDEAYTRGLSQLIEILNTNSEKLRN